MPVQPRLARLFAELSALHRLALPIIVAQVCYSAMGFVDTLLAGRLNAHALAAVALGNSLWIPVYLLMNGLLMATTPKVAHLVGAKRPAEIGPLVRQMLWLALIAGVIAMTVLRSATPIMHAMNIDPALAKTSMDYLKALACGFPAAALYQVLRCFSDGLGRTRPSMLIGLGGLALNTVLAYGMVYGRLGLPAIGAEGCGWATAISMWAMLFGMILWVRRAPVYRPSGLFAHAERPSFAALKPMLRIGLPIGIAVFAETSIFGVIALLIGSLGDTVVSGHQIALNFTSLTFMIPYSLGMAVSVRVGHALGAGNPTEARYIAGIGLAAAMGYSCVSAVIMGGFGTAIASLYTTDAALIAMAASLLFYGALYQLSDGFQVTAAGALRGYQDTRATMIITLFSYWGVGLPVGYLLGLTDWFGTPLGPQGLWIGLLAGLTLAAVLLGIRLTRLASGQVRRQRLAWRNGTTG